MSAKAFVPRELTPGSVRLASPIGEAVRARTGLDGGSIRSPLETQALAAMIVIRCRSGGMADAGDSKSPAPRGLEGSTPSSGTKESFGLAGRLSSKSFKVSDFQLRPEISFLSSP